MKKLMLLSLIVLFSSFSIAESPSMDEKSNIEVLPKIGPCLVFANAGIGRVKIVNSCAECRIAITSWCNGSTKRFAVAGYGDRDITTCVGTVQLVTDVPCKQANISEKVLEEMNRASCNAHNEVGDTCSISCPVGQSALCRNTNGAISPDCRCE